MARYMKPGDLSRITLISNPVLSPDGSKALFLASKADLEKDTYFSRIWHVDLRNKVVEPLTSGPSDTCPKWRPDGKAFSFLSRRTLKEGERGQEFWVWRPKEAEPYLVKVFRGGILGYEWSPNSKDVLILTFKGEPEEDVKVIDNIPVWFNGKGFTYWGWSGLQILNVQNGEARDLTPEKLNVTAASWSPDGSRIAYLATPDRLKPYISEVRVLNVKSGEEVTVAKDLTAYDIGWGPEGKKIAVLGHRRPHGLLSHNRLLIIDVESGDEVPITEGLDRNVGNTMNSDVRGPSCSRTFKWVSDRIYFLLDNEGKVELRSIKTNGGEADTLISSEGVVDEFDVSLNGEIIYTFMDPVHPKELFTLSNGEGLKLTAFNDEFVERMELSRPQHFRFKVSDGEVLDGWVMLPPTQEGKKLPWVLYIHGGPTTQFGWSFIHEFHVLNGKGFAVIFTNPRGSTGYSETFADIRGRYGERDFQDLMEFTDEDIKRFPELDREAGGVTGGSYGGFMTNWVITHTDRFKAAVTQRSISDWISMYGTTDIGFYFVEDQIGCVPWRDVEPCLKQSPLMFVENAITPTLIIHSIEDYRCWMDQALALFTALKVKGVEARLALFPKENHNLSRSGKPKHRIKRLELILDWFLKHLVREGSG